MINRTIPIPGMIPELPAPIGGTHNRRPRLSIVLLIVLLFTSTALHATSSIEVLALFKDQAIVLLDGKRHRLKIGAPTHDGIVLIAANNEEAIIAINGQQKRYTLGQRISNNIAPPKKKRIEGATITPDAQDSYYITGTINGFSVGFLVDTGATLVSMNSRVAKRIGLDYKLKGKKGKSETASGIKDIYIVNLKRVKVGNIELHNVRGAVTEGAFPSKILLGMSFLGKLDIIREGKLMRLYKKY